MKIEKIKQGNNRALLLFFAGWGMDIHPFLRLQASDMDVIVVYDYTELGFDVQLTEEYDEINLIAWSMGVWAATQVMAGVKLASAVAINGTPYPVHDTWGIPEVIAGATLANLSEDGLKRFNRRMCGQQDILAQFASFPVMRTVGELKEELASIFREVPAAHNLQRQLAGSLCCVRWTKALVSSSDRIFPVVNQYSCWSAAAVPIVSIDAPHYPFYLWNEWNEILCL